MRKFTFDVTRRITVELDPVKFNVELMEEFNSCITDFGTDDEAYEDHAKRIAGLYASGVSEFYPPDFVEGYGPVGDAGIKASEDESYQFIDKVTEGDGV